VWLPINFCHRFFGLRFSTEVHYDENLQFSHFINIVSSRLRLK
jgi:hypothetical protein